MHPMRMAGRGDTAPYWLGAAQLEADDSRPVRISPTVGSNPWRRALRQLNGGLSPVSVDPRVASTRISKLECPLQVWK